MTNSAKNKGDRAEREVEALLRDLLDLPNVRRALGAGRKDDVGDIHGIPNTVIQVAAWNDILAAIRSKLVGCQDQQKNANAKFGASFIRMRGAKWIVVMTPEQFSDLWKAANGVTFGQ
jgi:hypothetical protein